MYVVIAIALLVVLFAQIGKKDITDRSSQRKRCDLDWIDELELIDAALDDF